MEEVRGSERHMTRVCPESDRVSSAVTTTMKEKEVSSGCLLALLSFSRRGLKNDDKKEPHSGVRG